MHNLPVAIVGIASPFPGSTEKHGFWKNICDGTDLISEVPANHWLIADYYEPDPHKPGKTYCRRGAFISKVPFDPLEYGIPPSAISQTDTAQLLALIVAKQVLDDVCNKNIAVIDRERTSVILGTASTTELTNTMSCSLQRPVWVKALREEGLAEDRVQAICDRIATNYDKWRETSFPGSLGNVIAGRITNRFDLDGTNCIIDAACASSLAAVRMAIQELSLGYSDLVITGGVDANNDISMYMCFSKTPALSPTENCRPFAENADGTLLGEGIGLFALRRLEDAERDGNHIYAVIRGLGASSDGRAKSIYAPRPEGQAKALFRAYEAAGYQPWTVELLEAHGTGTVAGDSAEVAALKTVFSASLQHSKSWCALGSVKSQIGHTKAAAGSAALFKIVMALHHKVLPPTIKVDKPNPNLGLEGSPFYLNTRTRPWIRNSAHPRRASASAFGFGGSNYHIVVEEYQGNAPRPPRVRHFSSELILLSAIAPDALLTEIRNLLSGFQTVSSLATVAMGSQKAFVYDAPYRLALVAQDVEHARAQLVQALNLIETDARKVFSLPDGLYYDTEPVHKGKIAFLFPGQGSQYLEMGADLAMAFDTAREVWDVAADQNATLAEIVFPQPVFSEAAKNENNALLTATQNAQPAIGVTSQAFLAVLNRIGLTPDMVAGHSFGEVTALYCADVLTAQDFLTVAQKRGLFMAAASNTHGAMLAVFAPLGVIEATREHWGNNVIIANYNAPEQTVLAGPAVQIDALGEYFTRMGLTSKRLQVATAFHTAMVSSAVPEFYENLQKIAFSSPRVPVYANSTAAPYQDDAEAMRTLLANQIAQPVRFIDSIDAMYNAGVTLFIEVGPGSVLTELTKRCLNNRPHLAVALDDRKGNGVSKLWHALARLAVAGVPLNLIPLWEGYGCVMPSPNQHSKVTVMIDGANYGKAYPPDEGLGVLPAPNPPETRPVSSHADNYTEPENQTVTSVAPAPSSTSSWLEALERIQLQSAQTHQIAQQAMADAHKAYLQTTELLFKSLSGFMDDKVDIATNFSSPNIVPAFKHEPKPEATEPYNPIEKIEIPAPVLDSPVIEPRQTSTKQTSSPPALSLSSSSVASMTTDRLLQIISEATGFPVDMLKPEMELETDLGIDSIKRVEIFAAMQSALPDIPAVNARELANLRTIGAIASFMGDTAKPVDFVSESKATNASNFNVLIEVIATATGFPADMLKPEMELEADLGIDSIKRVEIFAALQSALPNQPAINTRELASLRTIGDIAHYFQDEQIEQIKLLPETQVVAPALVKSSAIQRLCLKLKETQAAGFALPNIAQGLIAIIDEGEGALSLALVNELNSRGLNARVCASIPSDAICTLVLAGFTEKPSNYKEAALAAFATVRAFVTTSTQTLHGSLVIIQNTGGDFGLSGSSERAWFGGFSALAKTVAQELPVITVKCIDIETTDKQPDDLACTIVNELLRGGCEPEVGLKANGQRLIPVEIPLLPVVTGSFKLPSEPVLVVSGGARGITAACIIALAESIPGLRLALLGRTEFITESADLQSATDETALRQALAARAQVNDSYPKPRELARQAKLILASREIAATVEKLQQLGAQTIYIPCDISDATAVDTVLAETRNHFGRIDGIIHGAGILADRLIADKTDEQFTSVFSAKIDGLYNLLAATKGDDLSILVLFSSVAGRYGNIGQCDYAMANATLNKVARSEALQRGSGCLVRSIGWGPWKGGMVTPELEALFKSRGVGLIELTEGTCSFVEEILSQPSQEQVDIVLAVGENQLTHSEIRCLDIYVDVQHTDYCFIKDHSIKGVPVLPMVMAVEWFVRAVTSWQANLKLLEIRDVCLVKGVLFNEPEQIRLYGRPHVTTEGIIWEMRLENAQNGQLYYTGKVLMGREFPEQPDALLLKQTNALFQSENIYDSGALFHGNDFKLITRIGEPGDEGISGELLAGRCLEWQMFDWCLDAGILDGALQLVLYWVFKKLNNFTLPTRIDRIVFYNTGVTRGRVTAIAKCHSIPPFRTQSDISIIDKNKKILLNLQGIDTLIIEGIHGTRVEPT